VDRVRNPHGFVTHRKRYANGGEDSKLKDWAGKTLPALKHHLGAAQAFDKNRK
jgi:putative membrane protein